MMNQANKLPGEKRGVPFLEIFKQAFEIIRSNRFLLWFGVLIALGSPGSFNYSGDKNAISENSEMAKNIFENHWMLVASIALALLAIGVALFLVSLAGKAGLIKSVDALTHNQKIGFRAGWKKGKAYTGKLFGLSILFFLIIFVLLLVLALPVIYLVISQSFISAILVGLLAVSIFIPLIFIISMTRNFAEFYVVLSDLKIFNAIETGYNLLLGHILNSIIFSLLVLAISMIAGFFILIAMAVSLLVFIPSGILFHVLGSLPFAIFIAVAIALFLTIVLFVSSLFLTYKTTAWTLFFKEIATIKIKETEDVSEEADEQIAAATEKA